MQLRVTWDAPSDISEWNSLAEANSNLLQSTYYDPVECSGGSRPVYFECKEEEKLVAGVKFFFGQAKHRLIIPLSRSLVQFGEMIYSVEEIRECKRIITEGLKDFIRKERIVLYKSSGYYSGKELLLDLMNLKLKLYPMNLAYLDLKKTEPEMWSNIYPTHRTKISKAARDHLKIEESLDKMTWLRLIKESFRVNPERKPNDDYLINQYQVLHRRGYAKIFECRGERSVYTSALIHQFGKHAYFAFGGNLREQLGAGHYFHWMLALRYKALGFERYYLGTLANNSDWADKKFRTGITRFKRHFGCEEINSPGMLYVIKPVHHFLFKKIIALYQWI